MACARYGTSYSAVIVFAAVLSVASGSTVFFAMVPGFFAISVKSRNICSVESAAFGPSLLSGLILCNGFLAAAHLVEDDVGRGFPDEGLRFIVPVRQPLINRSLQFAHTKESAAADHSVGDESEKAFHLIEPGTTGRCEVKVEAPPPFRLEPSLNSLAFMGGIVVHDQMHVLVRWHLFFQLVEKFDELLGAMARLATANHPAIQHVEGRA